MHSKRGWLVPLTGILGIVVLIAGFFIQGEPPDAGDPAREIANHFSDDKDTILLGAALQALAVTALVFFFAHVSRVIRLGEGDGGILSRVAFGGGLLFAAGGALDATLVFAMAEGAEDVRPGAIATLLALYENDFLPMAVGLQLFLLATGLAAWRLGFLPKWLAGITLVLAVVAVTPIGFASFLGMAIWVPLTGILLALRIKREASAPAI